MSNDVNRIWDVLKVVPATLLVAIGGVIWQFYGDMSRLKEQITYNDRDINRLVAKVSESKEPVRLMRGQILQLTSELAALRERTEELGRQQGRMVDVIARSIKVHPTSLTVDVNPIDGFRDEVE